MSDKPASITSKKIQILQDLNFGARTAEEEADVLANYFVKTDQWQRMLRGDIDVVYGGKGAGKSAIYTLLENTKHSLILNNIVTATAENPRGATIFRNIVSDPPSSERDFITLWKIYILGLLGKKFQEFDLSGSKARKFVRRLVDLNLLPNEGGLYGLFKAAKELAARYVLRQAKSVTWTATFDVSTGIPIPSRTAEYGHSSIKTGSCDLDSFVPDEFLYEANEALRDEGFECWILFDRLDVAFEDSKELEKNALRALFRVYNDIKGLNKVNLKIFVRDDIWRRITESGFAEASHITRSITIKWDNESLLNLAIRRLLNNNVIAPLLPNEPRFILESLERQRAVFYLFFPKQIDTGPKAPDTFEWILGRTKDGSGVNTPRELIHFLTELRDEQMRRFERGEGEATSADSMLFERAVFKIALKAVSETRLTQTLLAEYSELRPLIMALHGEKTLHSPGTLAKLWQISDEEAQQKAAALVSVGFFELRGSKAEPLYWVPFIYRDALAMVQGTAD